MVGQLILKEFKQNSFLNKKGIISKIVSLFSSLVLLALFITLEVLLYINVFDKLNVYTSLNDSLFIVISFILFMFGVFSAVAFLYSTFFKNAKEKIILGTSPASPYDIILAKSISVYFKLLVYIFSTIFALSIAYGLKSEVDFLFYVLMFFASLVLAFLCETIGTILLIPFNEIKKFINRFKIFSFILMIIVLIGLALLYGAFLNLFVNLIRNDDIGSLFTTDRVELLKNISTYLYPIFNCIDFAKCNEMNVHFTIVLAIMIFTFVIAMFAFKKYLSSYYSGAIDKKVSKNKSTYSIKLTSINGALIRKELSLALSNNDGIFSYISLIILEPFVVFSVISAVNLIFSTGNLNYISTLFPSIFLTVDVLLILLFLSVINTTSSISLIKEKNTLLVMKTIPVSYFKQLLFKAMVPSIISSCSYLLTLVLLVSFGEVTWIDFLFLIVVGLLSIVLLNTFNLFNDLKSKSASSFLSMLISYVFPVVAVVLGAVLSLLVDGTILETSIFFVSIIALEIIVLLCFIVKIKSRVTNLFIRYEGEAKWKRKLFCFYF